MKDELVPGLASLSSANYRHLFHLSPNSSNSDAGLFPQRASLKCLTDEA